MPATRIERAPRQSSEGRSRDRAIRWYILVFLAPATLIYTIFAIYPIAESLRLSLFVTQDQESQFVGLANYQRLLGEPYWAEQFWNAFYNNLVLFGLQPSSFYRLYYRLWLLASSGN